jgi:hypothetical protein
MKHINILLIFVMLLILAVPTGTLHAKQSVFNDKAILDTTLWKSSPCIPGKDCQKKISCAAVEVHATVHLQTKYLDEKPGLAQELNVQSGSLWYMKTLEPFEFARIVGGEEVRIYGGYLTTSIVRIVDKQSNEERQATVAIYWKGSKDGPILKKAELYVDEKTCEVLYKLAK